VLKVTLQSVRLLEGIYLFVIYICHRIRKDWNGRVPKTYNHRNHSSVGLNVMQKVSQRLSYALFMKYLSLLTTVETSPPLQCSFFSLY